MPRGPRKHGESGYYHVMLRGINRQTIFNDERDYTKFLEFLEQCKQSKGFMLCGYCLMSNHVHLLLREGEETLAQVIKRIGVRYAGWFNYKYARSGHLFQDRFKSEPIENERYLVTVLRYIHQNPVKAGISEEAREYRWSSYQDYVKGGGITDTAKMLAMFSDDPAIAIRQFMKLVDEPVEERCLDIDAGMQRHSDSEILVMFEKITGMKQIAAFQQLDEGKRDQAFAYLRAQGVSIRQIVKLTGSSYGVVRRK